MRHSLGGERSELFHLREDVDYAPGLRDPATFEASKLSRVADPAEIASAVLFLATSESSYMTGSELFADGGEVQTYR